VVLSACRSASGAAVEGSGVFGLARGFFRAGARAVVGGLWPMRDDEAASMMEAFARRLSEGKSVAGALASARMEKMAAGAPAAAWAGFVVLGDGSLVPFPGGLEGRSPAAAALVLLTALLAAAALLLLRRLRAR
jgi:CHAT domain-containing protein